MKFVKAVLFLPLAFLIVLPSLALCSDEIMLNVDRLSDRVLLLTEDSPMENIVAAIATEKGLVVIDTAGSYLTADSMRAVIEDEFGRNDFAYVINTHYHWDHSRGNQVFDDALIVGHELCVGAMRRDAASIAQRIAGRDAVLAEREERLALLDRESDEYWTAVRDLAFSRRNYLCQKDGFRCTPPDLVFNDRMEIDCGDVTLRLIYFGRAHSGSDILIHVPEEGLLFTGDLFLDRGWLPLFAGLRELDVPRFIETLGEVLDGDDSVKTVIPGHREPWPREKLVIWRDYIVSVWEGVAAGRKEGLTLGEVRARLPLDERCLYTLDLGHTEADLQNFHGNTIRAFWRQFMKSAAVIVEKALAAEGLEGALKKYSALKREGKKDVIFDENDFNALGYRLMNAGNHEAAVAVFELNAKAHPASWNVYDSLAEACLNAGDRARAIELYKKSIELNPDNANGRQMLERLEKKD